jgi:uncharacterized protein YndB with AHSA1/START domain
MSQTQISSPITLVVKRTFSAPRERVFRAWTDASELSRWFAPSDDFTTTASVDFRIGGAYRIEMHNNKDGNTFILVGKYLEIQAPEKLRYTWRWENAPEASETLVTVEFLAAGESTEVILTHEQFRDENDREKHTHGWNGCFDRLTAFLSKA